MTLALKLSWVYSFFARLQQQFSNDLAKKKTAKIQNIHHFKHSIWRLILRQEYQTVFFGMVNQLWKNQHWERLVTEAKKANWNLIGEGWSWDHLLFT